MHIPRNITVGIRGLARNGAPVIYTGPNSGSLCRDTHPFNFSDGRQTWYWVNPDALQAIQQLLDPSPARRPTPQPLTIQARS